MYLHKTCTSKARINGILYIQIEQYSNNKENIIKQNVKLSEKWNINKTKETINLKAKSKRKELVKRKIEERVNEIYKKECEKLKKIKCLNQ